MRVITEKFGIEANCHFNGIVRESRTQKIQKYTFILTLLKLTLFFFKKINIYLKKVKEMAPVVEDPKLNRFASK